MALRAGALVALALILVPATATAVNERYVDPIFPSAQKFLQNQAFHRDPAIRLDVWRGTNDFATGRAAIVYAHGGLYTDGSRHDAEEVAIVEGFAKRGFVVLNIDYRLDPSATPSDLLVDGVLAVSEPIFDGQHDMQAAVRWARANAGSLRIDSEKIYAMGAGAGGISAWQTAVNVENSGLQGNEGWPSHVAAGVSLWGAVQPLHVDEDSAPVIDLHGLQDDVLPQPLAAQGCALALARGRVCEQVVWPDRGHDAYVEAEDVWTTSVGFFCRHGGLGCSAAAELPVQVRVP